MKTTLIMAMAFIIILLITSIMDYDDEKILEKNYCERVRSGLWGDYKGTYKESCQR